MSGRIERSRLHLTRNRKPDAFVGKTDDPGSTLLTLLDSYVAYPSEDGERDAETEPQTEPQTVELKVAAEAAAETEAAADHVGSDYSRIPTSAAVVPPSDVDEVVARRLGVPAAVIVEASIELWGRSLTAERDDRSRERGRRGASSSTGRSIRGHVTRTLVEELRTALRGYVPGEVEGDDATSRSVSAGRPDLVRET